jgi:phage repressor protein C with HTH and peptisase S24 domain
MLKIFKVSGHSMIPVYRHGDYILLRICRKVSVNDIVVYQHPDYGNILKRVINISGVNFFLSSDNPAGIGQDKIGRCQKQRLQGKLLWHIKSS